MRAWTFDAFGPLSDVLKLGEVPEPPAPGDQECVVRVKAVALNFADMLVVEGKYQVKPPLPATPGMEGMGEVLRVGPGSRHRVGQRVIVNHFSGLLAEQVLSPDTMLVPVPDSMSDHDAAAFHVGYQTSYFALTHRANLRPGEVLLVHGAGGGVGTSAVQLGKALGARVIACASGAEKLAIAKQCGADDVIDTKTEDFVARVKQLTDGKGADVIYDPVGGETFDKSLKVIAWEGRLLVIGFASGTIPSMPANRVLLKNASVIGLMWGMYKFVQPEKVTAAHEALCALYEQKRIAPVLFKTVYPVDQLLAAFGALSSRAAYGRVIVTL